MNYISDDGSDLDNWDDDGDVDLNTNIKEVVQFLETLSEEFSFPSKSNHKKQSSSHREGTESSIEISNIKNLDWIVLGLVFKQE